MPFNLLLLPLIGGFLLLHKAYLWRYYIARFDGHRLIMFSALCGVMLLALSTLIVSFLRYRWPVLGEVWQNVVPFAHSGKSFGALLIGLILPLFLNRVRGWHSYSNLDWGKEARVRNAIEYFSNDIEILLLRSMDGESPVLLTMDNGKVYVGYVTELFNPDVDRRYIKVLPTMSGYRTAESQEVVFTTAYDEVRQLTGTPGSGLEHLRDVDFEIVLPVNGLRSASLFDSGAYERFVEASNQPDQDDDLEDDVGDGVPSLFSRFRRVVLRRRR